VPGRAQPIVQVVASIPATALFPAMLLVLLGLPGGLNLAAVGLMPLGTQCYVLFNVIANDIAGAMASQPICVRPPSSTSCVAGSAGAR
jgi:ABC-type anion transport system duplicated permease subunit